MMVGLIMLAPFVLVTVALLVLRARAWRYQRQYLTVVAWTHYAVRRRWFESDETLQERCRAVVRSLQ
jgi:hypothetical protein